MKISKISNGTINSGCVIEPTDQKNLFEIDKDEIIRIFKDKGALIFRNFDLNKKNLINFTDLFTKKYANDALRRTSRLSNKNIHDVDPGNKEMPLHSEASYSPSCPEIVWFYCNKAPANSGYTTICDGQNIYKKFNFELKKFFLENQIIYDLKIPFKSSQNSKKFLKRKKPWHIDYPGIFDCYLDLKKNEINFKLKRYAVIKDRYNSKLSFVNHLQIILNRDPQVKKIYLEKNNEIFKQKIKEVKKISDENTIDISWNDKDLCMINNHRFMHGRRHINHKEKRDIINIQTLVSKF